MADKEKKEKFYPCSQKRCEHYHLWIASKDGVAASININKVVACITCEYFQKQNNFIDRG